MISRSWAYVYPEKGKTQSRGIHVDGRPTSRRSASLSCQTLGSTMSAMNPASRSTKHKLSGPELATAARAVIADILLWIQDPETNSTPPRPIVAEAVRLSIAVLGQAAPGHSVEVRVPPFAAVQCVSGPEHRRGTPPNVVQCDPLTWLRLAIGEESLGVGNQKIEVSGTRAADVGQHLPLFCFRT